MAANRWDHSNILLSNQAGSIMGAGLADVGRNFGRGIERYYERKRQTEKEEATVEWLNQNEGAVNQLFPQLAQVKDPAERKKVIKAGIKGAGLENLVQVQGFMDQQRRQKEMDAINAELIRANTGAVRTSTANAEAMMRERENESRALRAAAADDAGLADQIMRGRNFGQLDSKEEPDRTGIYLRSGGGNPQMMQALAKSKPFRPEEFMTPSGLNMVQTSPNSFVPDPRQRTPKTAEKTGEYERLAAKLEAEGAFDLPPEKRTARQKADFKRLDFLNTRGKDETMVTTPEGEQIPTSTAKFLGWTPEKGWPGATGEPPGAPAAEGDIPTMTPDEAAKLPKGTKFKTNDGRILFKK